jgi:hypothetical protein
VVGYKLSQLVQQKNKYQPLTLHLVPYPCHILNSNVSYVTLHDVLGPLNFLRCYYSVVKIHYVIVAIIIIVVIL